MTARHLFICTGLFVFLSQGVPHVFAAEWAAQYEAALRDRAELGRVEAEIASALVAPTEAMAERTRAASRLDDLDPELQAVWAALKEEAESLFAGGSLAAIDAQGGVVEFAADFFGTDSLEHDVAMLRLGQMLLAAGDPAAAGGLIEAAAAAMTARLGSGHFTTLQARAEMAQVYLAEDDLASATSLLAQLIQESAESLGPAHGLAQLFGQQLETVLLATGQGDLARERLAARCGALTRVTGPWYSGAQTCLLSMVNALVAAGNDVAAEAQLNVYLEREEAKVAPHAAGVVAAHETLAQIEARSNRVDRALERLNQRLTTSDLDEQSWATLSFTKTQILMSEGAIEEAGEVLSQYAARARDLWQEDPHQLAILSNQEAEHAQRSGALNVAEALFQQSLAESQDVLSRGDPLALVLRNNLGQLYESMGLYDEAEPLLKDAVSLAEIQRGAGHPDTARQRNNLALLYESQGRFDYAEPLYEQAIATLTTAYGDSTIEVINLENNLAFLRFMKEDFEAARAGFERVLAQWAKVAGRDHPERLKAQNNLGRVLLAEAKFLEAEQILLEVLAMRRAKLGDNHLDVVRSRIDLGRVYVEQQRFEEAVNQLNPALVTAEAVLGEEHPYTFEALNALAKARQGMGDAEQAIELMREGFLRRTRFYDRVLWVTGENAREGYLRLHRQELSDYLAALVDAGGAESAKRVLEVSLMRKGLLLKITSEIQQISQFSEDSAMAELASQLRLARESLAKLTLSGPTEGTGENHVARLNVLEAEVDELQGLLGRASVRYRASVANLSVDDVIREIEPDSALFDVQVYESGGVSRYLIAGYQGGLEEEGYFLVDLGPASAIDESVTYHRETIQDPNSEDYDFEDAGLEVFERVFGPLEDVLSEVTHAYIIPDGLLNIAPFPAMFTAEGNYLIDQVDLQILTSSRDLIPSERRRAVGDYLIMAGPDYDATNREETASIAEVSALQAKRSQTLRGAGSGLRGLSFLPLPGAEKEGEIIAETIENLDLERTIYNRAQAEEAVVGALSESPRVLHIATHGFFLQPDQNLRNRLLSLQRGADLQLPPPGDNPLLRAGLAFAGINKKAPLLGEIDPGNDGVLTALEVLDLQLSGTHLVVLSACETGLGEIHEGEGVYGLRRAFQEAGVAEVVNSLWEVSDAGTQALMSAFYSRMMAGQTAREALRGAQLELKGSNLWRSPYIWSAFMMVGSYDTSGIKES